MDGSKIRQDREKEGDGRTVFLGQDRGPRCSVINVIAGSNKRSNPGPVISEYLAKPPNVGIAGDVRQVTKSHEFVDDDLDGIVCVSYDVSDNGQEISERAGRLLYVAKSKRKICLPIGLMTQKHIGAYCMQSLRPDAEVYYVTVSNLARVIEQKLCREI